MTGALIVGVLAAAGAYLVLQRGIVRIALGFILLGHAANVLLVVSGGTRRRGAPFPEGIGVPADPLPQAFALTAIVIGFGMTAFLLSMAFRSPEVLPDDDPEEETAADRAEARQEEADRTERERETEEPTEAGGRGEEHGG